MINTIQLLQAVDQYKDRHLNDDDAYDDDDDDDCPDDDNEILRDHQQNQIAGG